MTEIENIVDIFSILHDGVISSWASDKNAMTLTVECRYLAESIDKSFDRFYVELSQVSELLFITWPNAVDIQVQTLTEPNDIFKAELELLSAEIKDGKVVIACNQHDSNFDYCGGSLTIICNRIKIFDQNKYKLTIDELDKISKKYWNEWSTK